MASSAKMIALVNKANNLVSPTNLSEDLTKTMQAMTIMRVFNSVVLQQADIIKPKSDDDHFISMQHMALHQSKIKRLAHTFRCKVDGGLVNLYTDTQDFANQFTGYADVLTNVISNILTDNTAREDAIQLLTELEEKALSLEESAENRVSEMNTTLGNIKIETDHLGEDITEYMSIVNDKSGDMEELQNEIEELQSEITNEIGKVSISALAVAGGAVIIGVGAFASLPSAGTSASVVVTGVGIVAGGAISLANSANNLATNQQKLAELYHRSAELEVSSVMINELAYHTETLYDACKYAYTSSHNFSSEWHEIAEGLSEFKQKVSEASTPLDVSYLQTSLDLANEEWRNVHKHIGSLIRRSNRLKPVSVEDVLDSEAITASLADITASN